MLFFQTILRICPEEVFLLSAELLRNLTAVNLLQQLRQEVRAHQMELLSRFMIQPGPDHCPDSREEYGRIYHVQSVKCLWITRLINGQHSSEGSKCHGIWSKGDVSHIEHTYSFGDLFPILQSVRFKSQGHQLLLFDVTDNYVVFCQVLLYFRELRRNIASFLPIYGMTDFVVS